MAVKLLFVHALTSIHPGTGQGVGSIDLPVARERATNLPVIPGSTIKGCLRALLPNGPSKDEAFGKSDAQGKIRFSDARLLLLPVRSAGSTFVWATSPYVLRRFQRDCNLLGAADVPGTIPTPGDRYADMVDKSAGVNIDGEPRLILEDLDFKIREGLSTQWADWIANRLFADLPEWQHEFRKRFVVLSDSNFDFLAEHATEVNAHIQIGENGVVKNQALWYEESLPAETVLVSIIEESGGVTASSIVPPIMRLGGNETTGQGLARLALAGGQE